MTSNGEFTYVLSKERMIILAVVILIVWFSLLAFWWVKADAISKDPCSACAERFNEKVVCTIYRDEFNFVKVAERNYYPNGTISDVNIP
jgi:hypothetical protein